MKKLILLLLIGIMSLTAFSAGIEIRAGMDVSGEYEAEGSDAVDLESGGYIIRGEYLFGEVFEYGAGLAYKVYAKVADGASDDSSLESTIFYGTAKYNLGQPGMSPYIRGGAGVALNSSDVFELSSTSGVYTIETEVGLGTYYSFGAGLEYENFLVELVYEIQETTWESSTKLSGVETNSSETDLTFTTIGIEFGYKFGAGN